MINGIGDNPTKHPFTPGCGDPDRCWACGYYEEEHALGKSSPDVNAHLGATEEA